MMMAERDGAQIFYVLALFTLGYLAFFPLVPCFRQSLVRRLLRQRSTGIWEISGRRLVARSRIGSTVVTCSRVAWSFSDFLLEMGQTTVAVGRIPTLPT